MRPDAAVRTSALRAKCHARRLYCSRTRRPAARRGRRAARFRARRRGDERPGPRAAFRRSSSEERGGLRRLATACGSLGTLGMILEVSVKVLPKPVAEATLKFEMNDTDAVRKLNEWSGHPLPLTGSAWRDHTLALRLGGAEAAVKAARTSLGGEVVDAVEAERFWCGLREQSDPFFAVIPPKSALWRLSLPSIAEPMHLPGTHLMEWGGAQRWWITDADPQTVRDRKSTRLNSS